MSKLLDSLDSKHTEIVNFDHIKSLLEEEISVSALELRDEEGNTAFLKACAIKGAVEIVELLCDYGCNIYAKNKQNENAVCIASVSGDSDIIEYLVGKKDLDIEFRGQNKRTPVLKACTLKGNLENLKVLVKYQADLNKKDVDDMNGMNLASKLGDVSMVEFIAGSNDKNNEKISYEEVGFNGRTPFLNACSEKNTVGSGFENTKNSYKVRDRWYWGFYFFVRVGSYFW